MLGEIKRELKSILIHESIEINRRVVYITNVS